MLLFTESTLFLPHPLRIVLPMYVMEWSILILTRTHLLYRWKFFVAILVLMEEGFWTASSIQNSLGCSLLVLTR